MLDRVHMRGALARAGIGDPAGAIQESGRGCFPSGGEDTSPIITRGSEENERTGGFVDFVGEVREPLP